MIDPPFSIEVFENRSRTRMAARAPGEDDWMSTVSKIGPILGGVAGLGSLINSIIAARQSAEVGQQLISNLQTIESELAGIKSDLDAILQELHDIEAEIKGLRLNDKLDSIESWGSALAALVYDPKNPSGAQHLAAGMMDPSQPATNLLGCMVGLHNALVGEGIGKSLIELLDAEGFLRIRARLNQGLQLLAFACAFNTAEQYDYGVFLLQWAANFEHETTLFLTANKDQIALPNQGAGNPINSGDSVVIYRVVQGELPNIVLTLDGTGEVMTFYSGTLGYTMWDDDPMLGFAADHSKLYFVDLVKNEFSNDPNSQIAKDCNPNVDPNRWMWATINVIEGIPEETMTAHAKLVCGARYNPNQTFLGAVNGQQAWVAATDQTTYLCSIHDGNSTAASMLSYDATKGVVSAIPLAQLKSLSPLLWVVTWVSKGVVTISVSQAASAQPAYLSLDGSGNWSATPSPINLDVKAADPIIGPITNPYKMPPTPATITSTAGQSRTVLFHRLWEGRANK